MIIFLMYAIPSLIGIWWWHKIRHDRQDMGYLAWTLLSASIVLTCNLYDIHNPLAPLFIPLLAMIFTNLVLGRKLRHILSFLLSIPAIILGAVDIWLDYFCKDSQIWEHYNPHVDAAFDAVIIIQAIHMTIRMMQRYVLFRRKIAMYYADDSNNSSPQVRRISGAIALMVALVYVDIFLSGMNIMLDTPWQMLKIALWSYLLYIIGSNLHQVRIDSEVLNIREQNLNREEFLEAITDAKVTFTEEKFAQLYGSEQNQFKQSNAEVKGTAPSKTIEEKIAAWASRADHPYLQPGISLDSVADEMRLSPRSLSRYINIIYEQNFNYWINSLRIQHAKKLMAKDSEMPLTEIADRCGFADSAMLAKAFKRIEGITTTEFKRSMAPLPLHFDQSQKPPKGEELETI